MSIESPRESLQNKTEDVSRDTTFNRLRNSAAARIAGVSLTGALSIGLVACAQDEAPKPEVTQGQEATSNPVETEDPTAGDYPTFERQDPLPEELAPALNMSLESYKNLSPEERLTVLSWIIQYAPEFSDRYVRVSGHKWAAIPEPSASDTPSQIYAFERGIYGMCISFDDGSGNVDKNLTEKAIYAITGASEWDDIAAGDVEKITGVEGAINVDDIALQSGFDVYPNTIVSNSAVYTGPNGLPSMDIERLNENNYTINETYEFRTYTDYKGQEKHAWIMIAHSVQ